MIHILLIQGGHMKIYDKSSFLMGILWLCALPLLALDIIEGGWLKYIVTITISAMFFYRACSKTASERNRIIKEHFKETAISLYGRRFFIKTNLPWIIILVFSPIALTLRFVFYIWLPMWIYLIFMLIFTMSAFYSIGIMNRIKSGIEKRLENDKIDIHEIK